MADKAADIQTLAPRIHELENWVAYFKNHLGGSGGTTDEKLWQATLTGAEASATWGDEPWTATDLIYGPDSPNEMSMHLTVFGNDSAGALKCQDGKGLYGWLFPQSETRWQYGPENGNSTLATEIFGAPNSGYVHSLRTANINLMTAIFRDVEYVGDWTIIDRIEDVGTNLEELATQVEGAVGDVQSNLTTYQSQMETTIAGLQSQIDSLRSRVNALETAS
ncbi:hypothetical protein [Rhizobium terrae]|uniref:hypothetical protein n=1 Tax=Rhizobium terrae TaxID=2171756 RepID=UPI000E3E68E0|nr:hypothetical protein [Rhizobium terrae]